MSQITVETPYYTKDEVQNCQQIAFGGGGIISIGRIEDFGRIAVKEFSFKKGNHHETWKREIEILIKHRHPNIVELFGILWNGLDKTHYLGYVMEYVEGGSLHDVIHSTKSYDFLQIYKWIEQIARGLQFLHKKQIIHRDIKPQNILVAEKQLKLADFGISKNTNVTTTAGAGTNNYMAPEMISTGKSTPMSDIYSLAITMWEICHRKEPYSDLEETTGLNHLLSIINGIRPTFDIGKCDQDMMELIEKSWHKIASERPTAKEIADCISKKMESLLGQQLEAKTILIIGGGKDTGQESGGIAFLNSDRSEWIELEIEIPVETWRSGAVFLDEEIYIFGGHESRSVYKLDKNLQWKRLADMNIGRSWISNSAIVLNGYIWVFGGEDEEERLLASVERYDPKTNKWTNMHDMMFPRSKAAVAVANSRIIICGGWTNGGVTNTVECYDPDGSLIIVPELPIAVGGHCLVPHGKKFIIMGGYYEDEGPCDYVWEVEFHQTEIKWKPLPSLKTSCMWFGGANFDEEIYAIGGCHVVGSDLERVEIFNGKTWRNGPSLPINRFNMSTMIVPESFANRLCFRDNK